MNVYSLFNIEHTSNINVPNAEKIQTILNEIVTSKLDKLGLDNKAKKYIWQSDYNASGIKKIIQFTYRGTRGGLFVGTNFKFVPSITQNKKLAYYNHKLHLFENGDYFDKNYDISLWNEAFFRKSLKKFMDKNLNKIVDFLNYLDAIESNVILAKRQIKSGKFIYSIQDPDPKYVLVYLYGKLGNFPEANNYRALFLKEQEKAEDIRFIDFNKLK